MGSNPTLSATCSKHRNKRTVRPSSPVRFAAESCQSGRLGTTGNRVCPQGYRGFESHTLRHQAFSHDFTETNPAGEVIDGALPPMSKVKAHFRSLPYQEVGTALKTVDASQASLSAKLCFRFLVLTAARSGEARAATWDEIDMQAQVWRIPSERMKASVEHRVPLSVQALDVLAQAYTLRDESGLVFPSPLKAGSPMSDMTLTKVLRSTGLAERATVHGFRSSFKNWTLEQTETPWAVSEAALAHTLGNSTEQAYARSDLFERRQTLMQQWADYLAA